MKMNQNHNLFSFLSRGVTTTHPWCSVFILCFCFVFCSYSVSVSASLSNIPEMTDWQFSQALDAYAGLTESQKEIANFLVGSQGYAFAGIAQSNLNTSFSSYSETIDYVKNFGSKMWNQFNTHVDGVVQNGRNNLLAVKNDLSNFFGNAASYAKSRTESFSAWLGNVGIDYNSSSEFRIQFGKDQSQNNIDFYGDQGLYNWQYDSLVLTPDDFNFNWITTNMNGSQNQEYYSYLEDFTFPHVRVNEVNNSTGNTMGTYNLITGNFTNLSLYHNIFVNTSNQTMYICDDAGNIAPSQINCNALYFGYGYVNKTSTWILNTYIVSTSSFSNLQAIFDYLNTTSNGLVKFFPSASNHHYELALADFIDNLYVGDSWQNRVLWTSNFNLNLSSTSQYVTINAPTNVIYIDLNGFMHDLYENPTIIYNYVINNSVDENGDPVSGDNFQPTSKFPGIPDSGITIGTEFFKINGLNPLFGSNGYIMTLWNNTKGLVLYIGSIFEVLTIDGAGGFAYIIYGAISMGVIGGIFSKFLL